MVSGRGMIRRMYFIASITVLSLLSVESADICTECQCITKYFPSPFSIYFTDITCNATSTNKQINFDQLTIKDPSHVRDLIISGYEDVRLNTAFLSNNVSTRPSQQRIVKVSDVSHLHVENWCSFCNYSLTNISNIHFKMDLDASTIEIGSLLIKNSSIPAINSKNMYFKSIGEKVVLTEIEIHEIKPEGVRFHIQGNSSTFLMVHSKIGKHIKPGSMDVQAENIIITKTQLDGSLSNIRLNGLKKIVLTKNRIFQIKHYDFFDLYSPSIILSKNTLTSIVNNIKKTKFYG